VGDQDIDQGMPHIFMEALILLFKQATSNLPEEELQITLKHIQKKD